MNSLHVCVEKVVFISQWKTSFSFTKLVISLMKAKQNYCLIVYRMTSYETIITLPKRDRGKREENTNNIYKTSQK